MEVMLEHRDLEHYNIKKVDRYILKNKFSDDLDKSTSEDEEESDESAEEQPGDILGNAFMEALRQAKLTLAQHKQTDEMSSNSIVHEKEHITENENLDDLQKTDRELLETVGPITFQNLKNETNKIKMNKIIPISDNSKERSINQTDNNDGRFKEI